MQRNGLAYPKYRANDPAAGIKTSPILCQDRSDVRLSSGAAGERHTSLHSIHNIWRGVWMDASPYGPKVGTFIFLRGTCKYSPTRFTISYMLIIYWRYYSVWKLQKGVPNQCRISTRATYEAYANGKSVEMLSRNVRSRISRPYHRRTRHVILTRENRQGIKYTRARGWKGTKIVPGSSWLFSQTYTRPCCNNQTPYQNYRRIWAEPNTDLVRTRPSSLSRNNGGNK